jgi:hypothetical protein
MRRLYIVRIVHEAYVLADSQGAAEKVSRKIERWEEPTITSTVFNGEDIPGWDDVCCVYMPNPESSTITLSKAKAIHAKSIAAEPPGLG